MVLQVGVKAFIQNKEGKYLLLLRATPYDPGKLCKWDIPGGRINTDEPILEALAREIKEETNLQMRGTPHFLFAQDIFHGDKHVVRLTYTAKAAGKITLDKNEHTEFGWFTLSEIKKLYHDIYLTPVLKLLKK
jgi:8-oxo-dGTP diphosphatase